MSFDLKIVGGRIVDGSGTLVYDASGGDTWNGWKWQGSPPRSLASPRGPGTAAAPSANGNAPGVHATRAG